MSNTSRSGRGWAMWAGLAAVLSACGGGSPPSDPLAGTGWELREYADPSQPGTLKPVTTSVVPTLEFGDEGKVYGSGGCNRFNGTYTLQEESLGFGPLATTMMFCGEEEGVMDQESTFLAVLQGAGGFRLENGDLFILDEGGQTVAHLATS